LTKSPTVVGLHRPFFSFAAHTISPSQPIVLPYLQFAQYADFAGGVEQAGLGKKEFQL
jgi:hypothetical protein